MRTHHEQEEAIRENVGRDHEGRVHREPDQDQRPGVAGKLRLMKRQAEARRQKRQHESEPEVDGDPEAGPLEAESRGAATLDHAPNRHHGPRHVKNRDAPVKNPDTCHES